jgi:predicted O-methyltransferase YrrM
VDKWDDKKVYATFKKNIRAFTSITSTKSKVTPIRASSRNALTSPKLLKQAQQFDVIYIDADHHSASVMEDAVLAFPLLKPGGLLIFDDYTYSKERDNRCPKQAIDAFINAYAEQVHVKTARWQVVVQKLKHPRRRTGCMSEYFDGV